jgi:hypothetical protein
MDLEWVTQQIQLKPVETTDLAEETLQIPHRLQKAGMATTTIHPQTDMVNQKVNETATSL